MSKTKLNLGCGNRILKGAVNHDRIKHSDAVNITWDLNVLPWPWADEQFDHVEAWAVLEHLDLCLLDAMNEIWRITKPGGRCHVKLPYWGSPTAYQDPTHRYVVDVGIFDCFDPDTARGRDYLFYTPYKWRLVDKGHTNEPPTSVWAKLEKVVEWHT